MAKKDEVQFNYNSLVKELNANGPERLYFLWGPEDYLRELFVDEIKKVCLNGETDDFSYKLIKDNFSVSEFDSAVNSIPFMSERTVVEIRDFNPSSLNEDKGKAKDKEVETLINLLSDIPDYCTVIWILGNQIEPDGRIKLVKAIKKYGKEIKFEAQRKDTLEKWISKRFAFYGKKIDINTADRLIFVSGTLMNRLIPEIEKIAAYSANEIISIDDVEKVAHHIPEARVFDMTDYIASKDNNRAISVLADLLNDKDNHPIKVLALISKQIRQLYAARFAIDNKLGSQYLVETCDIKYSFIADKLMSSARGFTLKQLEKAIDDCCEADYLMKSTRSSDSFNVLTETVIKITTG